MSFEDPKETARRLASEGAYADWRAVCRKMVFDGYSADIFEDSAFCLQIDALCAKAREG